jgi:hypothetical protein
VPYRREDCWEPDPALVQAIASLSREDQIRLAGLAWIGRGTYEPSEWEEALTELSFADTGNLAPYIAGLPLLSETLEEGLAALAQERNLRTGTAA